VIDPKEVIECQMRGCTQHMEAEDLIVSEGDILYRVCLEELIDRGDKGYEPVQITACAHCVLNKLADYITKNEELQ